MNGIQFTTEIRSDKSEIGIVAWQEASDLQYTGIRKVKGTALLVVNMLALKAGSVFTPESHVRDEVEGFLGSEQAEKVAEAYNLSWLGDELRMVPAGKDTWFVWVDWCGQREMETERPGQSEWETSRGIPRLFY